MSSEDALAAFAPPGEMDDPFALTASLRDIHARSGNFSRLRACARAQCSPLLKRLNIRCDRNMGFEPASLVLDAYLGLWGARHVLDISSYDATLSQLSYGKSSDVQIIWLDWRLYAQSLNPGQACAWLAGRLPPEGAGHLLVNNWPIKSERSQLDVWSASLRDGLEKLTRSRPDLSIIDLADVAEQCQDKPVFDLRNESLAATPLSMPSLMFAAACLGASILPTLVHGRLRAVILDLDGTLYEGVLGESGPQGVLLTPGHKRLQDFLCALARSGIVLAIASKNRAQDVEQLFRERRDFPLAWRDFAFIEASWERKEVTLRSLLAKLKLSPQDTLFIDDNPAEIAEAAKIAGLVLLHAEHDANLTRKYLELMPRLFQLRQDHAAAFRLSDYSASEKREQEKSRSINEYDYLRSVATHVHLCHNQEDSYPRVAELSQKTNQFNLNHLRLHPPQVKIFAQGGGSVVTVSVRDKFSDSGQVGALLVDIDGCHATIKEFVMSCRVLGRHVETVAFQTVLKFLLEKEVITLSLPFQKTKRNFPAQKWVGEISPTLACGERDSVAGLFDRIEILASKIPVSQTTKGFLDEADS